MAESILDKIGASEEQPIRKFVGELSALIQSWMEKPANDQISLIEVAGALHVLSFKLMMMNTVVLMQSPKGDEDEAEETDTPPAGG